MYVVHAYVTYLLIAIPVTIWVAYTLHRNGRAFLVDAFHGNETLADSVNHLLVVGFYLLNIGWIVMTLRTDLALDTPRSAIELLSEKIGTVLLVLGVMHLFNVFLFNRVRRRALDGLMDVPPPPDARNFWKSPSDGGADVATKDTGARILEAALELFRERGFAQATMREIASRAGVASGLAYYYFDSKDAIVLAFYQRAMEELPAQLEAAHTLPTLGPRLRAIVEAKFKYFDANRRFLGALMSHAADPSSPLSPFGEPSRAIREFDIAQFERALKETRTAVPKDLAPHMAKILWMYQMGLLLFWIYDRSEGQRRSRELLDRSLKVVVALLKLSNLPLMRPARQSVLGIVRILEGAG